MRSHFAAVVLGAIFILSDAQRLSAVDQPQESSKLDFSQVVSGPRPEYPYEARRNRITGSGIIVLELDRTTGKVKAAYMAPSTGSTILDQAGLGAFRHWRFKPGTPSPIKIPIAFTLSGRIMTEYRVREKPMDEALAHFLGKGTVLKGPIPTYPRFPPWTDKRGKGVYELHVQKDGTVVDVKILRGSGDDTFDRITAETLRKWRFRRGPLVLELPLSFRLTPASYSVEIPKNGR
jgi:TonB family protein